MPPGGDLSGQIRLYPRSAVPVGFDSILPNGWVISWELGDLSTAGSQQEADKLEAADEDTG